MITREHLIHGHRLDIGIYCKHMSIGSFKDAPNINKQPDSIHYNASRDSRYLFLLKNHLLLNELGQQLKPLNAQVSLKTGFLEIKTNGSYSTVKCGSKWTKDVEKLVENFLAGRLVVHKVPCNNNKIASMTSEQLESFFLKDNTYLMQLAPSENQTHCSIIM